MKELIETHHTNPRVKFICGCAMPLHMFEHISWNDRGRYRAEIEGKRLLMLCLTIDNYNNGRWQRGCPAIAKGRHS